MRVADEQISSFQIHKEAGKRKQTREGHHQADANNNSSGGHDEDIKEDHEGRPLAINIPSVYVLATNSNSKTLKDKLDNKAQSKVNELLINPIGSTNVVQKNKSKKSHQITNAGVHPNQNKRVDKSNLNKIVETSRESLSEA